MKFLLDTQVVLWALAEPERLSLEARTALEDGANEVLVSVVSGWEIALKQSIGKLDLPRPAEIWLPEALRRTGFEILELGLDSVLLVRGLTWHHRDPFDRLLVAHAMTEGCTLVSRDEVLDAYGVPTLRG